MIQNGVAVEEVGSAPAVPTEKQELSGNAIPGDKARTNHPVLDKAWELYGRGDTARALNVLANLQNESRELQPEVRRQLVADAELYWLLMQQESETAWLNHQRELALRQQQESAKKPEKSGYSGAKRCYSNLLGFAGLFYQPVIKESSTLPAGALRFELQLAFSNFNRSEENAAFSSMLKTDYAGYFVALGYGVSDLLEIEVRTGYARLDGTIYLVDKNYPRQLIDSKIADFALDDTDLELTLDLDRLGAPPTWLHLLLNPLSRLAERTSQTASLAVKFATGSTDEYLSSGATDFSLSLRTTARLRNGRAFDTGLHYTMVGSMDEKLFKGACRAEDFFSLNCTYSQAWPKSQHSVFAGLNYNTRQLDLPLDSYGKAMLGIFAGITVRGTHDSFYFTPVSVSLKSSNELSFLSTWEVLR